MLEDGPRVRAYKSAIMNQKELFEGRCVMDVGAGSGILSVFCAQAGARKVIAVEASALAKLAEQIIAENEVQHIVQVERRLCIIILVTSYLFLYMLTFKKPS